MEFHDFCLVLEGAYPDVYDTVDGGRSSFALYGVLGERGWLGVDGETWTRSQNVDDLKTFPSEGKARDYILGRHGGVEGWAEDGREWPRFLGVFTMERGRLRRLNIMDRLEIFPRI